MHLLLFTEPTFLRLKHEVITFITEPSFSSTYRIVKTTFKIFLFWYTLIEFPTGSNKYVTEVAINSSLYAGIDF